MCKHVAVVEVVDSALSHAYGRKLAASFPRDGLRAIFVLSDGLNINGGKDMDIGLYLPPAENSEPK